MQNKYMEITIEKSTIMGPQSASSVVSASATNIPRIISKPTYKIHYRDALVTWADITRGFAQVDPKTHALLETMRSIIYRACDEAAKSKVRAEETENRLRIKGSEDDPRRTKLIEKILHTIAHESPSEKGQREVRFRNEMHH